MNTEQTSQAEQEKWYTVDQAAEYLGISRPTLFRWMKEGTLTYFKVGGSTRFTREGLDAVVEKNTGSKEAEAVAARCSACGHGVLVAGNVQGNSRMYFRPDKSKFWTLREAMVPVRASVCTACGFVQLRADAGKLRRLTRDQPEESETMQ